MWGGGGNSGPSRIHLFAELPAEHLRVTPNIHAAWNVDRPAHARRNQDMVFHMDPVLGDVRGVARDAAFRLMGRKCGLIRSCRSLPFVDGMPRLHTVVARGPLRVPGWWFCMPADGTGVSADPELAQLSAIGEVVERYCGMARSRPESLLRAAFRDVNDVAVNPATFSLFSDDQYRRFRSLAPLKEESVVDWCWAYSLARQAQTLIPAALVYFDRGAVPPNNFLPELGSSGLASHVSLQHAILAGLCEVLERDALTIAWHTRLPLVPLDPDEDPVLAPLTDALAGCDVTISLFEVPTDGPFPVVLALAESDHTIPHAVVGAACRPDLTQAAARALCEVAQMLRRQRERRPVPPLHVKTFDQHADFYSSRRGAGLLRENLIVSCNRRRLRPAGSSGGDDGFATDLDRAVSVLFASGLDVLVAELTTADVAAVGYRVVRVVVPGAVDMSADARFIRLGGSRLFDVAMRLGLPSGDVVRPVEFNLLPVPLA